MSYEEFLYAEMNCGLFPPLASIEAARPVFMIVMGVFLMIIAWRLSRCTEGWTSRLIISGALLLGFGYGVLMPLYEAGGIERFSPAARYHGSAANAVAWHAVKLVSMNSAWLLLGLGLAMHARIFTPTPARRPVPSPILVPHEFVA